MSSHSLKPWTDSYSWDDHLVGVMFAGREGANDDLVYLGVNAFWEAQQIEMPLLPEGKFWKPVVDTARGMDSIITGDELLHHGIYVLGARSVVVMVAS